MKQLKDSIKSMDEKYVSVETLSDADKKNTYGGAVMMDGEITIPVLKYGLPPITPKYGVPPMQPLYGVPPITEIVTE